MGGELSGGCRKYLLEGPVIGLTWEEKRFIEKRVVGRSNRTERKMHQRRKKKNIPHCFGSGSGLDLDSGVFRIRILGLKKSSKMLNNRNIILLFRDFYNILSFS